MISVILTIKVCIKVVLNDMAEPQSVLSTDDVDVLCAALTRFVDHEITYAELVDNMSEINEEEFDINDQIDLLIEYIQDYPPRINELVSENDILYITRQAVETDQFSAELKNLFYKLRAGVRKGMFKLEMNFHDQMDEQLAVWRSRSEEDYERILLSFIRMGRSRELSERIHYGQMNVLTQIILESMAIFPDTSDAVKMSIFDRIQKFMVDDRL